jgi:hypothetical protein
LRGKPYVITQDGNRIKELLESKGKTATIKTFGIPHWDLLQNAKDRNAVAETRQSDAAIALSSLSILCLPSYSNIQ